MMIEKLNLPRSGLLEQAGAVDRESAALLGGN
jgi:hypothetical protein